MADPNKNSGEALPGTQEFCLRDLSKAAGDAELGAQAARNEEIRGVRGGLSAIN